MGLATRALSWEGPVPPPYFDQEQNREASVCSGQHLHSLGLPGSIRQRRQWDTVENGESRRAEVSHSWSCLSYNVVT